jgi:hypothetical protein
LVWYTHVLPRATGNGIELALANDADATPGRTLSVAELAPGPELAGPELLGPELPCPELPPGAGLEDCEDGDPPADEVAPVAAVWLDTWGAVPFGTPLHPARTTPARAAPTRADTCLLM